MTAATDLPLLLAELEAVSVERISPTFVRVVLGAPALADYGVPGPRYDQRIKLIFPTADGALPDCSEADADWLMNWYQLPESERGSMRTYTICDVLGEGEQTRFVVDFVVHDDGHAGPGASWAMAAKPGDRLLTVAPRRGADFGGIEFAPPAGAGGILLVGDESAVPAIASILGHLDEGAVGAVFLEVPDAADIRDLAAPPGVELAWYARGDHRPGARVVPAVRQHVGLGPGDWADAGEVDPDLWETPVYSSSGSPLEVDASGEGGTGADGGGAEAAYAWIAGESLMVTTLRRALVAELGMPRSQVCFMGYWRQGVAMRG